MSRIDAALARARAEERAALVVYLCAGDPDLALTPALIRAAADAGADVVELGVPFSDPTADGVVIQRASERALRAGASLRGVLAAAAEARRHTDVPIVLFGYYNPLLTMGEERVVAEAKAAGVDGFLVVDLPPEECAPLRDPALRAGLDWISLVAPTSTPARIELAAQMATSFVYFISVAGVTGAGHADLAAASARAAAVRERTGKPVAVGFGVRTVADVRAVAAHADAVVVGSAVVSAIEAAGRERAVDAVSALVRDLASGTKR